MSDDGFRDKVRLAAPHPWDADTQAGPADGHAPVTGFTSAVQWGLASLLIGCTLLLAACVVLVFNVLLFRGGPAGIPTLLAFAGGVIGTLAVSALGLASLLFGMHGWRQAYAVGSSPALGVAGVTVNIAGLVAWTIAALDLLFILHDFIR
jgi:hypothetical protein